MSTQPTLIKRMMLIISLLIIISLAAIFYFKNSLHSTKLPKAITIDTTNQPLMGSPKANLHMVVFEDLKCGNCARYNNTLFPAIYKKYISTGKASYTMINLAFIPGSLPAANAARCLYMQNKSLFFPFVKYVYENQPAENTDWANIPRLIDFAGKIPGVKMNEFADCLVKRPYDEFIQNNFKEAQKVMQNKVATPSLYINGVLVRPLTKERIAAVVNALD